MTILSRLPVADSAHDAYFPPSSGTTQWEMLDELADSHDGDSTYVSFAQTGWQNCYCQAASKVAITSSAIAKIQIKCAMRAETGASVNSVYLGVAMYGYDLREAVAAPGDSYVVRTYDFSTNPYTSAPWTEEEVEETDATATHNLALTAASSGTTNKGFCVRPKMNSGTMRFSALEFNLDFTGTEDVASTTFIPSIMTHHSNLPSGGVR